MTMKGFCICTIGSIGGLLIAAKLKAWLMCYVRLLWHPQCHKVLRIFQISYVLIDQSWLMLWLTTTSLSIVLLDLSGPHKKLSLGSFAWWMELVPREPHSSRYCSMHLNTNLGALLMTFFSISGFPASLTFWCTHH